MDFNLTLVIQGVAFFAVAWLVMKFGWPNIMAAIEQRQAQIAEGLAAADRSKKDLAQAEEKVNEALREARGKAAEIIAQAEARANQIVDAAKDEAIAEGNRQKAAAQAEIVSAATRAFSRTVSLAYGRYRCSSTSRPTASGDGIRPRRLSW